MVQLFYYENRGKCCRKLWKHNGNTLKVNLHVEESWAETSGQTYLVVTRSLWRRNVVSVVEVSGTKMLRGKGKMMDNNGHGTLWIRGSFQSKRDKFFKLTLSSEVSECDFQLGYCLTGVLERAQAKYAPYAITHLAFVRRGKEDKHEAISGHSIFKKMRNRLKELTFTARGLYATYRADRLPQIL